MSAWMHLSVLYLSFSDFIPLCVISLVWKNSLTEVTPYIFLNCGDEVALLKEQKCCCCWMVALRVAAGTLGVLLSLAGLGLTDLVDKGEEHLPQLCCF